MAEFRLNPVSGVAVTPYSAREEKRQRYGPPRGRQRTRQHLRVPRLVERLLPDQDPENCTVELEYGDDGFPAGLVIRRKDTGTILLEMGPEIVDYLQGDGDGQGTFLERSG